MGLIKRKKGDEEEAPKVVQAPSFLSASTEKDGEDENVGFGPIKPSNQISEPIDIAIKSNLNKNNPFLKGNYLKPQDGLNIPAPVSKADSLDLSFQKAMAKMQAGNIGLTPVGAAPPPPISQGQPGTSVSAQKANDQSAIDFDMIQKSHPLPEFCLIHQPTYSDASDTLAPSDIFENSQQAQEDGLTQTSAISSTQNPIASKPIDDITAFTASNPFFGGIKPAGSLNKATSDTSPPPIESMTPPLESMPLPLASPPSNVEYLGSDQNMQVPPLSPDLIEECLRLELDPEIPPNMIDQKIQEIIFQRQSIQEMLDAASDAFLSQQISLEQYTEQEGQVRLFLEKLDNQIAVLQKMKA
jgi:hypothetical protein